ncbi:MAG: hypothetical protein ACXAD7_19205 [Candidatus Kariarchaeaceae archaeon]
MFISILTIVRGQEVITDSESLDGEDLGEPVQLLVIIAFSYAVIYRLYHHKDLLFRISSNENIKQSITRYYRLIRRPLLAFHVGVNLIATLLATVHGLVLIGEDIDAQLVSGIVTYAGMLILSLTGLVIYFHINPFWSNKRFRGTSRLMHKQWIITSLLIIGLVIHTGLD